MTSATLTRQECGRLGNDPSSWGALPDDQLAYLVGERCSVLGQILDLGASPDTLDQAERMISRLYLTFVDRVGTDVRRSVLGSVTSFVEQSREAENALLPFIYFDPEMSIATAAALDLAMLSPIRDGDVLTGPRVLRSIAESTNDEDARVAALGGLLLLGDRRVQPLLHGCWRLLGTGAREELTRVRSGFAYAASIDFFLDWFAEEEDDSVQGTIAAAVARLPRNRNLSPPPMVLDVERNFPAFAAADGEAVRIIRSWSFDEYARLLEPRLRQLAADERGDEKVMPLVIREWGLHPDSSFYCDLQPGGGQNPRA